MITYTLEQAARLGLTKLDVPPSDMPSLGGLWRHKAHGQLRMSDGLWYFFRHTNKSKAEEADAALNSPLLPQSGQRQ